MKQRIVTGLVAGFGFGFLLWVGGGAYTALVVLMAGIGYFEFSRMNGFSIKSGTSIIGLLLALYLTFPFSAYFGEGGSWPGFGTVVWLGMFILFAATVATKNKVTIDRVALQLLGVVYIGGGFSFLVATRLDDNGLFWSLFLFACVIASDSGAYFTGRAFGKRPLWPAISPNKTVEGLLGGITLSVAAALCFSLAAPELLAWTRALWLGAVIAVVGTMGDLIQSAYKRVRHIKDTGAILPGHGGVLDRCDSWLIVFPFVQLLSLLPQ